MLNISSKRYIKNEETQGAYQMSQTEPQSKCASNKITYTGKIFEPSSKARRSNNDINQQYRLVLADNNTTMEIGSCSSAYNWSQVKRESSTTLSITTEASSDMCNSEH